MLRTRAFIGGLLLALVTSVAALGQSNKSTSRAPQEPAEIKLVSMKFAGGTVADYVSALKKSAGDVNIIAAAELNDVPMPPVELTDASIGAALNVLDGRTIQLSDRLIKLKLREESSREAGEHMVYAVEAFVQGRPANQPSIQRVWSVKSILNGPTKANDLLTAIQTSLDLLGDNKTQAQLKFHEATGLIIVRANGEQIDAIQQVIEQLDDQSGSTSKENAEHVKALESALNSCRMESQNLRDQLGKLQKDFDEARKR